MDELQHYLGEKDAFVDWVGQAGGIGPAVSQAAAFAEFIATRGMSGLRATAAPAKQDYQKSLRSMIAAMNKKNTSAINMSYGKRRNTRSKRRNYTRSKSRKPTSRRYSKKKNGSANMLAAIHKALAGKMRY